MKLRELLSVFRGDLKVNVYSYSNNIVVSNSQVDIVLESGTKYLDFEVYNCDDSLLGDCLRVFLDKTESDLLIDELDNHNDSRVISIQNSQEQVIYYGSIRMLNKEYFDDCRFKETKEANGMLMIYL